MVEFVEDKSWGTKSWRAKLWGAKRLARWDIGMLRRGLGPSSYIVRSHPASRPQSRVCVSPALNVNQILLARKKCAETQSFGRSIIRRMPGFDLIVMHRLKQSAHYPIRDPTARIGIDVTEQNEMAEQHAPIGTESTEQSIPVQFASSLPEQVVDVRAIESFPFHHKRFRPN